jgi:hypothetical protein
MRYAFETRIEASRFFEPEGASHAWVAPMGIALLNFVEATTDKGGMVNDKALLLEVLLTGFLRSPASAREGLEWSRLL